ncbi:MAG: 50S ribosomal protein L11 methyltransferase [Desulfobacterales bacterium]
MSTQELRDFAVEYISTAPHKVSPPQLQKVLSQRYLIDARRARAIIRRLLAAGELSYTYEYGTSYLEMSPRRPLKVTERIVIVPPGIDVNIGQTPAAVRIMAGAAFGCGRHPTTRLALRGIDAAMSIPGRLFDEKDAALLDIGTGSGILALAALKLGIGRAVGIDLDPCARAEALQNTVLNGLESRFLITKRPLSELPEGERFEVVTANLRYPTLMRLCGTLVAHLARAGLLVFSGIKNDELDDVMALYGEKGFVCRWQATEKGWVALVLQQRSLHRPV